MQHSADDWSQYIDAAIFAINTSIHSTTKYTPFRMMYGREPLFPLEAEVKAEGDDEPHIHPSDDYVEKVIKKQQQVFEVADERIKTSQIKQKEQYLKRKGLITYDFKVGDKVLRRNMKQKTRKGYKSEDRWLGPYIIIELTKTTCCLKNYKSSKQLKTKVSINQLKPYHQHSSAHGKEEYNIATYIPNREHVVT